MEAKVMRAGDLCILICQEHINNTGESKNCDGLDCEQCTLEKQANLAFKAGQEEESTQAYNAGVYDGIMKGRKEIVEWVDNNYPIGTPKWSNQKKEWGIDNG